MKNENIATRMVFHFNEFSYRHYLSRKGIDLQLNPKAALLFYWEKLNCQIRIEGLIDKVTGEESDNYFYTRPLGSQIGAIASEQSQVIESREFLEKRVKEIKLSGKVTRPEYWGGYRLMPHSMEFWLGRESRLHDRFLFTKQKGGKWNKQRLAP